MRFIVDHRGKHRLGRALFLAGTAALALAAAPALAQDQTSGATVATSDGDAADQVGDIIVTAQLRNERLQDVPISVQVLGNKQLTGNNLLTMSSLAQTVPSVRISEGGRSSAFFIRGIGSAENQSFDQSVGTFVDGIYHGRSRATTGLLLDLDHVEILKGPQSTFFGNNTIAGAFNILTKKPGTRTDGWVRGLLSPRSGTNGGQYAIEGAGTIPLGEGLGLRLAGTYNGQHGWLENVSDGRKVPQQENYAGRATLAYEASDVFDIVLKGEYGRSDSKGGAAFQNANCPPPAPFTTQGFCATALGLGSPIGIEKNRYSGSSGVRTTIRLYETALTANYHVGDHVLTSVTGYWGFRYNLNLDTDGTPLTLLNIQAPERYHQFSQELRLSSPTGGTIEYLAGLYFQSDRLDIEQSSTFFFFSPAAQATPALAPLRPYLPLAQLVNATQDEKIYSAFASLSWNASDRFKLSGGLRASWVKKSFDWQLAFGTGTKDFGGIVPLPAAVVPVANALGLGTAGAVSLDRTDNALMPSVRAQYELADDVMAYASYSRGFKAGGFNVADTTASPANFPFDPEHVDAYEIGFKSELFDRRLTLNVAAFRMDYSDLQVSIPATSAGGASINFVRNAAQARSQGIELESSFQVVPEFRLSAAGTYLDSKYRNYLNASPTITDQLAGIRSRNLSNVPTQFAPKWSGSVTGTLTLPFSDNYRFTAEATGIFSSFYYIHPSIDPYLSQPGYGRLDMRLSLETSDGRLGFDIIGKNLTDTVIRTVVANQPRSLGALLEAKQQPSNIAFQVRYKF